jgi:hypothetical protein
MVKGTRKLEAIVLVAVVVSACGGLTPQQQAAAAKVQITPSDPAANCQNLGPVTGSSDGVGSGSIRGKTVLLGGNTARVDAHGDGMAFYCPEAATRAPIRVIDPAP